MKKASIIAVLLVLALSIVAIAAAQTLTEDSDANIQFKAGGLIPEPEPSPDPNPNEPGAVNFTKMALEFGERNIPIRAETYVSDGSSETTEGVAIAGSTLTAGRVGVLIKDSRATNEATGWTYTAALSQFVPRNAANRAFDATLFLNETTLFTNVDQGKLGTSLMMNPNNGGSDFVIQTNNTAVTMLTALSSLGKGSHGASWTNGNIAMKLAAGGTASGFDVITNDVYTATMTWTLTTTN